MVAHPSREANTESSARASDVSARKGKAPADRGTEKPSSTLAEGETENVLIEGVPVKHSVEAASIADAGVLVAETMEPCKDSTSDSDAAALNEQVVEQQNAIRSEVAASQPLVAEYEALQTLLDQYKNGSELIQAKIVQMSKDYRGWRRTRGDGNCFFRAFSFQWMEHLIQQLHNHGEDVVALEITRVQDVLITVEAKLKDLGYQEFVYEDFIDAIRNQIDWLLNQKPTIKDLERSYGNDEAADYVVMALRLITSCQVQTDLDLFAPFIESDLPPVSYCHRIIEAMGECSEQVQVVALSSALGIPIGVAYLDKHGTEVQKYSFEPMSQSLCQTTTTLSPITMLYRPGHYDILYNNA